MGNLKQDIKEFGNTETGANMAGVFVGVTVGEFIGEAVKSAFKQTGWGGVLTEGLVKIPLAFVSWMIGRQLGLGIMQWVFYGATAGIGASFAGDIVTEIVPKASGGYARAMGAAYGATLFTSGRRTKRLSGASGGIAAAEPLTRKKITQTY